MADRERTISSQADSSAVPRPAERDSSSEAARTDMDRPSDRIEHDLLGEVRCRPRRCTACTPRARWRTSPSPAAPVHGELVRAYGTVKLACALHQPRRSASGPATPAKADAIERACRELADGLLDDAYHRRRLQGGAGTRPT